MKTQDHDPDQMSFRDLDAPSVRGRRRKPCLGIETIEDAASPTAHSAERNKKVLVLRWLVQKYVRSHGVGAEFQAIDFSTWARAQEQFDATLDLRSSGGMFVAMVNAGILEQIGFRNNGGDKDANYHGTPRTVYRINEIDFSKLGWPEDLSGIEQRGVWTKTNPPKRKVGRHSVPDPKAPAA